MYIDKDFEEKIKKLPSELQEAIEELDLDAKMMDIIDKNELLISEGDYLYQEVKMVLTGEKKAADFRHYVTKKLDAVDDESLKKVIDAVNDQIFTPIKEHLMRLEKGPAKEETEEEHLQLKKDDVLKEIEEPAPAQGRVVKSAVVAEMSSAPIKIPNALEKKTEVIRNAPDMSTIGIKKPAPASPPDLVSAKLNEVVKAPKKEIEVKPEEKKPAAIDPYREPM